MVDYTMLASKPFIDINAIGNALAVRQHLQDQPLRQMREASALKEQDIRNRILGDEEVRRALAERVRQANIEELINMGINGPQAAAGAANIPSPQNALAGMTGAPTAAPTPQGWTPPMALPPEGGNALAATPPQPAPVARIPYSPEAEAQLNARMSQQKMVQEQLKEKIDLVEKMRKFDPELAQSFWKQDPVLSKFGVPSMTGDGDIREHWFKGKLIGTSIHLPDGKWEFKDAKSEALSEPGKLMNDRDKKIASLVSSGVKPEDALNDPDVKAFDKRISEGKSAYPLGHIQQFQVGRNMVYREYMGEQKWKDRPDLGGGPKDLPPQVADDFKLWDKETKEWHFENFKNTGVKPDFGWGKDAGRSRAQFQKEYAGWNLGKGVTGAEAGAVSAEFKALSMSLRNQEKIRGMMGGFVRNMDKQVVRVDDLFNKIVSRAGVRALDLPLREIKTRAIGSGNEAIIEAYLLEISNEIGKLSTGSAASIQELSKEAQVKWAKIHDPNLSPKEIKKILTETRHMGQLRLDSSDEEIKATQKKMKNVGEEVPTGAQVGGKTEQKKTVKVWNPATKSFDTR